MTIRCDPRDLAEIRVYHEDRFLCRALCLELAAATIGLKDLVRARNARRVVLIGLPGIEKRLARYPQLYSRVGFVHHVRPLSEAELRFILAHKWREVGLTFAPEDWTDAEAPAALARVTGGNLRLVQRLFAQIERVLEINRPRTITQEVVETARENLVIGP